MSLFVAGTDTGIGKTVISTILTLKTGWKYWKPVQSGLDEITDSEWAAQFVGKNKIHPEAYRLKAPLSPHASAELENVRVELATILERKPQEAAVIEGSGGLLVPLNDQDLIIDLVEQLKFPVVLVARSALGTINHTLLSLTALRARAIPLIGVVLVGDRNEKNKLAIEHFGKVKVLGEVPWITGWSKSVLIEIGSQIAID